MVNTEPPFTHFNTHPRQSSLSKEHQQIPDKVQNERFNVSPIKLSITPQKTPVLLNAQERRDATTDNFHRVSQSLVSSCRVCPSCCRRRKKHKTQERQGRKCCIEILLLKAHKILATFSSGYQKLLNRYFALEKKKKKRNIIKWINIYISCKMGEELNLLYFSKKKKKLHKQAVFSFNFYAPHRQKLS